SLQDEQRDVWSRRRCGALGAEEDGECCREAVQEGSAADRSDLAAAEEAGDGWAAERLGDRARVVVGLREHVRAAPVAAEEERAGRRRAAEFAVERLAQVLVGARGVAKVEAQRLANAPLLADGD